jgi:hypothetical protein
MRTPILIAGSVCCVFLSAQPAPLRVDLARIGQIAPKGRVQDKYYNPDLPVVAKLIEAGPRAIPFLVSKLEDKTPVKGHVIDFWLDVRVGDIAWIILCDFFTTADWQHSTINPRLDSIIEDQKLRLETVLFWQSRRHRVELEAAVPGGHRALDPAVRDRIHQQQSVMRAAAKIYDSGDEDTSVEEGAR